MELVAFFIVSGIRQISEMEGVWKKSLMVLILALFTGKRSVYLVPEDNDLTSEVVTKTSLCEFNQSDV